MSELLKLSTNRGNRNVILVSFLILSALIATLAFSASGSATANSEDPQVSIIAWQTSRVTNTKAFAWMGDRHMRLDSTGKAHVAYGGDSLYYAYFNGTAWVVETVDSSSGVGLYASLALDSNNRPHISYYDAITGSLKYARKVGSAWERFVLDTPSMASAFEFADGENPSLDGLTLNPVNVKEWGKIGNDLGNPDASIQLAITMKGRGLFTSIAMDPFNDPHIAYYDAANGDLKYAHKVYSGWQITAIDTANDTGQYASIAVAKDSNDKLFTHFSYYDVTAKDLRYAKWSAESASVVDRISVDGTADGDIGKFSSIVLTNESNPQPRISYYAAVDSKNTYLKYAAYKSNSWVKENVTAANQLSGQYSSLALDKSNNPHISYVNATDGKLKLAVPDSSGWSSTGIAAVGVHSRVHSAIAVDVNVADANSDARVSFLNAGTGVLQFATQSAENWSVAAVDGMADLGAYNALSFDNIGNPHITFFNDTHDDLMYARWNGSAWEGPFVVDQNGDTGLYNDIVMNGSIPHIAYYNASSECLRYATWVTDHWQAENVECGKRGMYASISLDTLGRPHISYYDEAGGNLKWAYKDGGIWKTYFVDMGGDGGKDNVGLYTSIAIDSANQPHISYYDATNNRLRYAMWQIGTGTFRIEHQVDFQSGQFSQIALDSQGRPHIAYMDDLDEDRLKHAWKTDSNTTNWSYETVDPNLRIWSHQSAPLVPLSIVVDTSGTVHIGYFDFDAKNLRYARKASGSWSYQIVDSSGDNGQYISIAANPTGGMGMSYYDAINGDLKYASGKLLDLPYSVFLPIVVR